MSIKDEFSKINIPEQLSERTRKGIEQAEKEKKKKSIMPLISTVIVTAATMLFMLNFEQWMPATETTAAAPRVGRNDGSRWLYIFPILVFAISALLVFQKKMRIRWMVLATICASGITWNLVTYENEKLIEPIIVPLMNVEATDRLTIHYFVNKEDDEEITALFINGEAFNAINPNDVSLQRLPTTERFKNQQLKAVFIQTGEVDFSKLLAEPNTIIKALFNDGSLHPVKIEPYVKMKTQALFGEQKNVSYGMLTKNLYQFKTNIISEQNFHATAIEFPENMINHFAFYLSVTPFDEQKNDWDFKETETYFHFTMTQSTASVDIEINKGDLIEITIENMVHANVVPLLEDIIIIQTSIGELPIVVNDHHYLNLYEQMLPVLTERQRGDKNGQ